MEDLKLFHHAFAKVNSYSPWLLCILASCVQIFNYIIKNNIKLKNIYNIDEKDFFISLNKFRHSIVRKGKKNQHFSQ